MKKNRMRRLVMTALIMVSAMTALNAESKTYKKPARIIATDFPDLHAAVKAAVDQEIYNIYVPAGLYTLEKTLDLANLTWYPFKDKEGRKIAPRSRVVTFEGAGRSTVIVAKTGKTPAIDLSGSKSDMILRNFLLCTPLTDDGWQEGSEIGILLGRLRNGGGVIRKPGDPKYKVVPSAGGHSFQNVSVNGMFRKAAVYSYTSEINTFIQCNFSNELGDAFIFTKKNILNANSVRGSLASSSNAGQYFYSCCFQGGTNDGVGLRVSGTDVYVYSSFFSGKKDGVYSGIYLDGTMGTGNLVFRDIRCECSHAHDIVAVGAVANIIVEGGQWIGSTGNIVHYEKIPDKKGAHRIVCDPTGSGRASNWSVRNIMFSSSFEDDPALTLDKIGGMKKVPAMEFDSLIDSRIVNNLFLLQNKMKGKVVPVTDQVLLLVKKYSRRNYVELPSREAVVFEGDARNNIVVATCDDHAEEKIPALWRGGQVENAIKKGVRKDYEGVRRQYLNPDQGMNIMNLGLKNVYEIRNPKAGDLAMHDGTNLPGKEPRLAMYNGKKWIFLAVEDEQ